MADQAKQHCSGISAIVTGLHESHGDDLKAGRILLEYLYSAAFKY